MSYKLPYQAVISGGLFSEKKIAVSGTVLQNSQSFYIDLRTDNDIALRFSPRLDENVVVRNSQINGTWGAEERTPPFHSPFKRGQDFTVEITCKPTHYSVSVDGQDLLDYKYRLHELRAIDRLVVDGDLKLNSVDV